MSDLTTPNTLFLSSAARNNHHQLSPIHSYFKGRIAYRSSELNRPQNYEKFLLNEKFRAEIVSFMKNADIGIDDIRVEEEDLDEKHLAIHRDLEELFSKHLSSFPQLSEKDKLRKILFSHKSADGSNVDLDMELESRGTITLLNLLGPALDALANGKLLVVDELDSSVHPLLSRRLVHLFNAIADRTNRGQLIFTTHDTNLLDKKVLRRDQIWFTEKSKDGATCLYPLSDIKTRKGDNFEKGYLSGRYGAIPYLGTFDSANELVG
ncbi:AAA family ATPase [Salinisphaera shabanensis]|uniref:AAA family ATPase n=1 Tax=Salinisphaera shabanensis TaxID=180542 RepID=UPI0023B87BD2|nr:ATP-binding protein [Salinisphaera shabanensis]